MHSHQDTRPEDFSNWLRPCFCNGMNIWLLLIAAQILITVVALIRERGDDRRFAGEKLGFRS